MLYDMMLLCDLFLHPSQSTQRIYHTYSYSFIHYNTLQYEMYPLRRQDIWIKEQSGKLGQASQQGPLEWKQIAGRQDMAGPYRRWTNYSNPYTYSNPLHPKYQCYFLVWFVPSNGRNKSNPQSRNSATKP